MRDMLRRRLFSLLAILIAGLMLTGCVALTPKTSTRFVGDNHELTATLGPFALPPEYDGYYDNEELQLLMADSDDIDLEYLRALLNEGNSEPAEELTWEIISGPGHFVGTPATMFDENNEARAVIKSAEVGTTVVKVTLLFDESDAEELGLTIASDEEDIEISDTAEVFWVARVATGGVAYPIWTVLLAGLMAGATLLVLRRRQAQSQA